ncbi:uncharacterized protein LOC111465739 [Cucurbita maxima]|uniref:Uncharacterized protein LOC111465739 n=1 Tax=Cucurbita maxima TaxID=3661 RepID=A0A6J1HQG4_CUCMA|nr:uncharacterized protein LOC111465739 [Cucurbita maxima]
MLHWALIERNGKFRSRETTGKLWRRRLRSSGGKPIIRHCAELYLQLLFREEFQHQPKAQLGIEFRIQQAKQDGSTAFEMKKIRELGAPSKETWPFLILLNNLCVQKGSLIF